MKRHSLVLLIILFFVTSAYALEQKLTPAYEQELIQRVKGVFSSEGQKEHLGEPIRPVCATPIFTELFVNYDKLSDETKKILSPLIRQRPDSFWTDPKTYDTPGGHFKIHYVISGDDAVFEPGNDTLPADGHPDYVNRCSEIMDYVWHHEIDTLGFNSPPPDDWYTPNGGDGKYDVYLVYMETGYMGYTYAEHYSAYPGATSYLVLRNDYSMYTQPPYNLYDDQYDAMKVTAAHEFFHSIQMGYDAAEYGGGSYPDSKPYWMEITAVWMEDIVYDDINDYLGYIYYFFRYPWLSLKTFSYDSGDKPRYYHAYASCIWAIYLSEKFGQDIIKDIWVKCGQTAGDNVLSATSQTLSERGTSLEEAFQEFTIWNYFTSTRADTQTFYSEGHFFDPVYIYTFQEHSSYPVDVNSVTYPPENLGSNYVALKRPYGAGGGLSVGFYGDSLASWEVSMIGYKASNPWFSWIDLNAQQNGEIDIYNWDLYDRIIMIPAVTDLYNDDNFDYAYTAAIDSGLDVEEAKKKNIVPLIKLLQNYPNPFNLTTTIPFTVNGKQKTENRPFPTTLKIYNILGQEIRVLVDEEKLPGTYEVSWDGKDNNGTEVASGIYFYKLQAGQHTEIKKMLLVK